MTERSLRRSGALSPFIEKLWILLSDEANQPFITWNEEGNGISIKDPDGLMREVLPKYFRQGKLCSFARQLNNYGFVKVLDQWEFRRDDGKFIKDDPSHLCEIRRRAMPKKKRPETETDLERDMQHLAKRPQLDFVSTPTSAFSFTPSITSPFEPTSSDTTEVPRSGEILPSLYSQEYEEFRSRQRSQEEMIHQLVFTVGQQMKELQSMRDEIKSLTSVCQYSPSTQPRQYSPGPLVQPQYDMPPPSYNPYYHPTSDFQFPYIRSSMPQFIKPERTNSPPLPHSFSQEFPQRSFTYDSDLLDLSQEDEYDGYF